MLFFVFVCTNLLTIVDMFVERERNGNFAVESRSRADDSQVSDEHRTDAVSTNLAGASSSADVIYFSIIDVVFFAIQEFEGRNSEFENFQDDVSRLRTENEELQRKLTEGNEREERLAKEHEQQV